MTTLYYKKPAVLHRSKTGEPHMVIEASAGTGKTYTLEHLVLDLLIGSPANPAAELDEIVIVTFTEAATRELKTRIRALIERVLTDRASLPEGADPKQYWAVGENEVLKLRRALFRFDSALISTIHGFCQQVLAEQAFLSGRMFEEKHADGALLFGLIFREEIRLLLAEESTCGNMLRSWLSEEQTINALEEFLYQCHREGSPERCPLTPVWNPEKLRQILSELPSLAPLALAAEKTLSGRTLGSMNDNLAELKNTVEVLQENPANQDNYQIFTKWATKKRTISGNNATQLVHLQQLAQEPEAGSGAEKILSSLEELIEHVAEPESFFVYQLLPRVQEKLALYKNSTGLFDFDDLLLEVHKALNGPEGGNLLKVLRGRWRYALVDEFQDTDLVQWQIFRKIFIEGGPGRHLVVIGDPKQAIYGFRGADVYTYDRAKEEMTEKHGATRLPLTKNYRSTEAVIHAINQILTAANEEGKSFFSGLNRYDDLVELGNPEKVAVDAENRPLCPLCLITLESAGRKLKIGEVRKRLYSAIGMEIKRLLKEPGAFYTSSDKTKPRPIKPSDIFILTRTGAESLEVGNYLRCLGVPYAYYKQEGLFQTEEAQNIHILLQAIDRPFDPALSLAALLTPFFAIPLQELPKWQSAAENHPAKALLYKWHVLAQRQDWSKLFEQMLNASGLTQRLLFTDNERALTNYLHLLELLLKQIHARPLTTAALARHLEAHIENREKTEGREDDVQRLEGDQEAVQILTMHKAKGLEAEVVFIAGGFTKPIDRRRIKTSIYHHNKTRHLHIGAPLGKIATAIQQETKEENERLLYVAITRAKSRLYLPYFASVQKNPVQNTSYNLDGSLYGPLQKQLQLVLHKEDFKRHGFFKLIEAACPESTVPGPPEKKATSFLPPGLLAPSSSRAEETRLLKESSKGVILTSYSRINQGKDWSPPPGGEERPEELPLDEDSLPAQKEPLETGPAKLPSGRLTGLYLHSLLEEVSFATVLKSDFISWSESASVQNLALKQARRYAFKKEHICTALKLVYNALRVPLKLEAIEGGAQLRIPEGLASVTEFVREMPFVYPIPEKNHPLLSTGSRKEVLPETLLFKAERGYLQGLIDLVFKYHNRYYLLDWKSDQLEHFSQQNIGEHVANNYQLQAIIYSFAVTRMLKVTSETSYNYSFGGVIYAFLRGLEKTSAEEASRAVWFSRPSFGELQNWETELLNRRTWGA